MTPREVARLMAKAIFCQYDPNSEPSFVETEKVVRGLAALAAAGFAVVPAAVKNQIDRLPTGAPTNQIEALAWIAAAMEAKSAMLAAAEGETR